MKVKFIFIFCLFLGVSLQIVGQTPVPEDLFDMYDGDEVEEEGLEKNTNPENKGIKLPNDQELKNIMTVMENAGALGGIFSNAISSGEMILGRDCSSTYVCMYNTVKKMISIYGYEHILKFGDGGPEGLTCVQEKSVLEDYAMFLLSMNLDLYCIEHLRGNEGEDGEDWTHTTLTDEEIIDAMLAMGQAYMDSGGALPSIANYQDTYLKADPYCTNDLGIIDPGPGENKKTGCSCGEYTGTLDLYQRDLVVGDIKNLIDQMNPLWQAQKAVEINRRLKELPCNN
ncbi:MAG: hypothetical protein R2786_02705 [Flavobacteriaceae bacterium]